MKNSSRSPGCEIRPRIVKGGGSGGSFRAGSTGSRTATPSVIGIGRAARRPARNRPRRDRPATGRGSQGRTWRAGGRTASAGRRGGRPRASPQLDRRYPPAREPQRVDLRCEGRCRPATDKTPPGLRRRTASRRTPGAKVVLRRMVLGCILNSWGRSWLAEGTEVELVVVSRESRVDAGSGSASSASRRTRFPRVPFNGRSPRCCPHTRLLHDNRACNRLMLSNRSLQAQPPAFAGPGRPRTRSGLDIPQSVTMWIGYTPTAVRASTANWIFQLPASEPRPADASS